MVATSGAAITARTLAPRFRAAWVFGLALGGYLLAAHHRPINAKQYVYMAEAFLNGSLALQNLPDAVAGEAIPIPGGSTYAYGVVPALLLLPFVAMWGRAFDPGLLIVVLGAVNVLLMYRVLCRTPCPESTRLWLTLLFAFGTVHFHASVWGTAWFFMQLCAVLFLLLAIHETLGRKRGLLIGLALGAAVLSRNVVLLSVPFFLIVMHRPAFSWQRSAAFGLGLGACLAVGAWYNWARFGNPLDNGYSHIFYQPHGLFHWRYVKQNLYTYFFAPPEWLGRFPYLRPSLQGMSVLLTSPAFLLALGGLRRSPLAVGSWIAVAGIGGAYLMYFWGGFAQFGVRYVLDLSPFVMLLLAVALKDRLLWWHRALIIASVVVNAWGVAWWRFGNLITP